MTRPARLTLAAVLAAALAIPTLAAGIESAPRVRFFIKAGMGLPGSAVAYPISWDPHPEYVPTGSYARQTLNVEPASGLDLTAGFFVPIGRVAGLSLWGAWSRTPLGGANATLEMLFKYTLYYPMAPWDNPLQTSLTRTLRLPMTEGALREGSFGLDLSLRVPLSCAIELSLFAGPRILVVSGKLGLPGYIEYMGSSHGAQMFRNLLVRLGLPSRTILGAGGGLELALRPTDSLAFTAGASYLLSADYQAVPEIEEAYVYYGLTPAAAWEMTALRQDMALDDLTLSLRRLRFAFGISFGL